MERGLSQESLAFTAGVALNYLSGIERGARNPTARILEQIAHALRVPPAELLAQLSEREALPENLGAGRRRRHYEGRKKKR